MTNKNYSSDSPISSKEEDKFSRWPFAERIAQIISRRDDPSSLVIGLYGVWGDGKTSVLNFIEKSLESDDNVICIKFNPWRFISEDELLTAFFFTIADALDTKLITKGDQFKELLKKSAPHVASLAGVSGAGHLVSSFISTIDTNNLKKRVEHELEIAKKRVLILIDDVDRLDKIEIHTLFKVIKLTADFKYTSYILAFDKDIVSASLQDRYANTNHHAGEDFLEKIIQIPLNLPSINKEVLREFCFNGINQALALAEIDLTEKQVKEFVSNFITTFDDCLLTPRKAKLYGNILLFSLPILKDEVNPIDLMLIEGIRVFCPSLYELLRNNKGLFTGTMSRSMYANHEQEKDKIKNIINTAFNIEQDINKENFIALLKNLFPKLQSVYGNMYYGDDIYMRWEEAQRVCSTNYFPRYFTYAISNDDVSDKLISNLLSDIKNWHEPFSEDKNPLNNLLEPHNAEGIIRKLRNKVHTISVESSYTLAVAFAQGSRQLPNPETLLSFLTPLSQAAILFSQLIKNIHQDKKIELILKCIDIAPSLEFKLALFRWLDKEDEERPEKDALSNESINEIGIYLGQDIITRYIPNNEDVTLLFPRSVSDIFNILHQYVDGNFVTNYVTKLSTRDHMAAVRIIINHTPTAWSESGKHKSDFKKENYNSLANKLDISTLVKIFEEHFSHLLQIPEDYPNSYNNEHKNEDELLVQQFLWIHNKVLNEADYPD